MQDYIFISSVLTNKPILQQAIIPTLYESTPALKTNLKRMVGYDDDEEVQHASKRLKDLSMSS